MVIALLALGIGANAAIFGVVDRLLLSPPAGVRDAGRVGVFYFEQTFSWAGLVSQRLVSYPMYRLMRDESRRLEGVAAYTVGQVSLGRGAEARQVARAAASANFFRVLGVAPRLGRVFTEAEDQPPTGQPVVVLSDAFWRGRFGGDARVLGRVLRLGATSYTVIGVLPPGFSGIELAPVDVWTPLSASASEIMYGDWPRAWGDLWLTAIGRLRPGVSLASAEAEATGLFRRGLAQQQLEERAASAPAARQATNGVAGDGPPVDPTARAVIASVIPGRAPARAQGEANEARVSVWLAGVALLVLLIACANVASLLLARAFSRRKEIAVRLALGVSRGRLVRQLMVETLVLAFLAGDTGLLFALVGGRLLRAVLLPGVDWQGTPLSGHVLALTAALIVASALLAGLAPALQSWRVSLSDALKSGVRGGSQRRSRLRAGLVVAQAALTVVLLVGAGLFVRSLRNLQAIPRGFEPQRVLLVEPGLARYGFAPTEIERRTALARERLVRLPGVQAVALTTSTPFRNSMSVLLASPGLDSVPTSRDGGPYISAVSPEYFRVMGTRIVAGRGFSEVDGAGAARVAIVNGTMAHLLWPGQNPIGRCLQVGGRKALCSEVVGVAENALRQSLDFTPVMQYYVPLAQHAELAIGDGEPWNPTASLLVRAAGPAGAIVGAVRREVQAIAPDMPYAEARPLEAL
ncbi:MAG TPA: ABC transporter permease, partial [Longimicrobiales bacterium]